MSNYVTRNEDFSDVVNTFILHHSKTRGNKYMSTNYRRNKSILDAEYGLRVQTPEHVTYGEKTQHIYVLANDFKLD